MNGMLPATRTTYCPHVAHLCEYATCGLKNIMDCAVEMMSKTDALPDDLKPYGEALTKIIMGVLSASYVEHVHLIAELGMRDIAQAALPPEQQTEQELLQRSGSDEIC
jgi:hypothetical protein